MRWLLFLLLALSGALSCTKRREIASSADESARLVSTASFVPGNTSPSLSTCVPRVTDPVVAGVDLVTLCTTRALSEFVVYADYAANFLDPITMAGAGMVSPFNENVTKGVTADGKTFYSLNTLSGSVVYLAYDPGFPGLYFRQERDSSHLSACDDNNENLCLDDMSVRKIYSPIGGTYYWSKTRIMGGPSDSPSVIHETAISRDASGKILSITDKPMGAQADVIQFHYDGTSGLLTSITGPLPSGWLGLGYDTLTPPHLVVVYGPGPGDSSTTLPAAPAPTNLQIVLSYNLKSGWLLSESNNLESTTIFYMRSSGVMIGSVSAQVGGAATNVMFCSAAVIPLPDNGNSTQETKVSFPLHLKAVYGFNDVKLPDLYKDHFGLGSFLTYNAYGQPLQVLDDHGYGTRYEYDGERRLTRIFDVGASQKATYDARGATWNVWNQPSTIKDNFGNPVVTDFDSLGRWTSITYNAIETWTRSLTGSSGSTFVSSAFNGHPMGTTTLDAAGSVVLSTAPPYLDGSYSQQLTYDATETLTGVSGSDNNSSNAVLDQNRLPSSIANNPPPSVTGITRNGWGEPLSESVGAANISTTYDGAGRATASATTIGQTTLSQTWQRSIGGIVRSYAVQGSALENYSDPDGLGGTDVPKCP